MLVTPTCQRCRELGMVRNRQLERSWWCRNCSESWLQWWIQEPTYGIKVHETKQAPTIAGTCTRELEKAMAPHSSTLAWKIPWTEEPGRLQSMGSLRIGHDWRLPFHFSLSCVGEGNGNPLQCSCLENPRDGGAWWAAVYGVTQSRTRLKWLSSSIVNI